MDVVTVVIAAIRRNIFIAVAAGGRAAAVRRQAGPGRQGAVTVALGCLLSGFCLFWGVGGGTLPAWNGLRSRSRRVWWVIGPDPGRLCGRHGGCQQQWQEEKPFHKPMVGSGRGRIKVCEPRRPRFQSFRQCSCIIPGSPRAGCRPGKSESGGIGRRAGFRFQWGNPWEFESPLSHQF